MALKIIMYHYIRDAIKTRYKGVKACSVDKFREQIRALTKNCNILGYNELCDACQNGLISSGHDSIIITFDDGFSDHYMNALPILDEFNAPGLFFPPARPVLEGKMLDVHKIHLILSEASPDTLSATVVAALREVETVDPSLSADVLWRDFAVANRFDPAEVVFVKRMLQFRLPQPLRSRLIDELFKRHVSGDEAAMAAEWYLSLDQLRYMIRAGHYVGGHGYAHHWMNLLTQDEREQEITATISFLARIGAPTQDWIMAYPYGAYDDDLPEILVRHGCAAALGTKVSAVADPHHQRWALPRLDTNDVTVAHFPWID